MNYFNRLFFTKLHLRQQLAATFALGIILLALASSFVISNISRANLFELKFSEGANITQLFAEESKLALLYQSQQSAEESVRTFKTFPDVTGVGIYNLDLTPLYSEGDLEFFNSDIKWQESLSVLESQVAWHFTAPVYANELEDESPFSDEALAPELIGYVYVLISKETLNSISRKLVQTNFIVSGGFATVLLLLLLLITNKAIRPINHLAEIMRRAEDNKQYQRANLEGPKDIIDMENAFNTMMIKLGQRERDLKRARDSALAAASAKGEFAANVSHELRTPMNGIMGMLELLDNMDLSDEQREHVRIARNSSRALLILIDDILDFSKLESAKMKLRVEKFNLVELLNDIYELLSTQAHHKNLYLKLELDDEVHGLLQGDSGRLRQILLNIVGNAVKFTITGGVTLLIEKVSTQEDKINIKFSVIDTGIGVPEDAQKRIFEAFTQVDGSATRQFGGTGLGLAICQQLVSLMGGTLGLESKEGLGSTFWFTLPLEIVSDSSQLQSRIHPTEPNFKTHLASESTTNENLKENKKSDLSVLVAEDDPVNQMVIRAMLERLGYQMIIANNGKEAIELARNPSVGIILMDCHMPIVDGYEATRQIISEFGGESPVPIIALTANVSDNDRIKCQEAGMADYLTKPLELNNLKNALQTWFTQTNRNESEDNTEIEVTENSLPLVDIATIAALDKTGGISLFDTVDHYIKETSDNFTILESAIERQDYTLAINSISTVRNASSAIGARKLVDCCKKMEIEFKNNNQEKILNTLSHANQVFKLVSGKLNEIISYSQTNSGQSFSNINLLENDVPRITIICKDDILRMNIRGCFDNSSYTIEEFKNGVLAVEASSRNKPSLFIIETQNAFSEGFTTLKNIRQLASDIPTPILAVVENENSLIEQALHYGASDIITKPIIASVLKRRTHSLIKENDRRLHRLTNTVFNSDSVHFSEYMRLIIQQSNSLNQNFIVLKIILKNYEEQVFNRDKEIANTLHKIVSKRISTIIRPTDLAIQSSFDEYIVVFTNLETIDDSDKLADKISTSVKKNISLADTNFTFIPNTSVLQYPQDASNIEELVEQINTSIVSIKKNI